LPSELTPKAANSQHGDNALCECCAAPKSDGSWDAVNLMKKNSTWQSPRLLELGLMALFRIAALTRLLVGHKPWAPGARTSDRSSDWPSPPGFYAAGYGGYLGPDIITRNLTPNKDGLPEGGNTLAQFTNIMRTGHDPDNLHPTCTTVSPAPSPANCIPAPVDGSRLQIMPWPVFHNMSDHDIEAIYEYLSAVPCIAGPAKPTDLPPPLQYAFPVLQRLRSLRQQRKRRDL
jgi:hypothetical protein